MDSVHLYPCGFHPVRNILLYDCSAPAPFIPRRDAGVKYHFIDYGVSSHFPPGSWHRLVVGRDGRDQDIPELSDDVPYDPFKVDVYTIGSVLHHEFCDVSIHPSLSHKLSNSYLESY